MRKTPAQLVAAQDYTLQHAVNEDELLACFPAMSELRPDLQNPQSFVAASNRMANDGYQILAVRKDDAVVAVAGYRLQENFVFGRFLYVDDLVTKASSRGRQWGTILLMRLREIAAEHECSRVVLDTALGNTLAQRFYFRLGMLPLALGFSIPVDIGPC